METGTGQDRKKLLGLRIRKQEGREKEGLSELDVFYEFFSFYTENCKLGYL